MLPVVVAGIHGDNGYVAEVLMEEVEDEMGADDGKAFPDAGDEDDGIVVGLGGDLVDDVARDVVVAVLVGQLQGIGDGLDEAVEALFLFQLLELVDVVFVFEEFHGDVIDVEDEHVGAVVLLVHAFLEEPDALLDLEGLLGRVIEDIVGHLVGIALLGQEIPALYDFA